MERLKIITVGVLLFLLMLMPISASAEEINIIGENETAQKSQFLTGKEVSNEGTIQGDLFAGAGTVSSSGTIQGDLIAAGNSVSSLKSVGGDVICAGETVDISGDVMGDIRCAGSSILIAGKVGKNVNAFAATTRIKNNANIDGNLLALGEYIRVDGKVKGYTKILGKRVILNGEFFGDVDINMDSFLNKLEDSDIADSASITILPGTIIHGKLTYGSKTRINVPKGAVVKSQKWIKIAPKKARNSSASVADIAMSFLKMLLGAIAYFLVAMLLLKLFPGIFRRLSDAINDKPLQTAGVGFAGMFSILAVFIALIILIIFSALFSAWSLGVVATMLVAVFYTVIFYLALMPVSLWLGDALFKDKYTFAARFALGLGVISFTQFILNSLGKVPSVGAIFEFLSFIVASGIGLLGVGALLKMAWKVFSLVRKYDPAAE